MRFHRIERAVFGAVSAALVVVAFISRSWLIAVMAGLFVVVAVREFFEPADSEDE